MLLIIMRANSASNCCATWRIAAGSWARAPALSLSRPAKSPYTAALEPEPGRLETGAVGMEVSPSDDDQLGAQRAGFLQGLEDRHQVTGGGAHLVHRAHDLIEIDAGLEDEHAGVRLLHVDVALGYDHSLALRQRARLAVLLALDDGHREGPMRHRRRGDPHVRADDDRAGARVDDDARRRLAGLDFHRFERRHVGDALAGIERGDHADRHRIE